MSNQESSVPISLRYRPDEIAINSESPFESDKLGREPFVTATTDLLRAIREPFVIALSAPWGSGKTTTLRLLEPTLSAAGVTTVSFNAWQVDYATDPLVPLVASLHDRLLTIQGYGSAVDHQKIDRLKTLGSAIIKHGAVAAVKVATAGMLNLDTAADGIVKAVSEAAEKAGEGLTGDLIDAFKQERLAAEQFRVLLGELIAHVRKTVDDGDDPPPLVLVIDELDRCRPTFAVAMLERIKHFFDVPGLVFLLALDLEQLKASTRKVYGADLDAAEYLRRFVDLELRLPRARAGNMVNAMLSNCGADTFFAARQHPTVREDRSWVVNVLQELAQHFELSPRMVQRMVSRLMLVLRQTPTNHYLDPILVVFMIFLRIRHEKLLEELVAKRVQASDVMATIRAVQPGGEAFYESHVGMVIEAHLLYAHNEQQYVGQFLQRAMELDPSDADSESTRIREVARRYEGVRSANFQRMGLNLRTIDQRINLVATDLTDER